MNDTKQKILDAAERLFSENGYAATSLRHIISEAKVNLAAIHYHFGSKQDLLDQVILRKASSMNESRLKLLDQFEAEAAPESASVEKIVVAFILPAILIDKSPEFVKLMGRVHAEGLMPEIARRNFQPIIARFHVSPAKSSAGFVGERAGVESALRHWRNGASIDSTPGNGSGRCS